MDFTNNDLRICDEALPIALSQDYSSTDSNNCNLKTENRFAKPAEIICAVPPHQLIDVLAEFNIADGTVLFGSIDTNLGEIISWKGTIDYRRRDLEIREISGRKCTKGDRHKDGCAWLEKTSPNCKIVLSFEVVGRGK